MMTLVASAEPRIRLDGQPGWQRFDDCTATFWFKGYEHTRSAAALAEEAVALAKDRRRWKSWLRGLDGHFALAVRMQGWALAATDRVGSMPLIWSDRDHRVEVTQDGPGLEKAIGLSSADIDPAAARAVAMSGYTIGDDTLYRGVRRLTPGQFLWITDEGAAVERYHLWDPWQPGDEAPEDLTRPLSRLHTRLIERLIGSARGGTIFVPLSAGLDSRMILSGLVEAGYGPVRAFTYGIPGNREAAVSRDIASRLGVPWTFVPYDAKAQRSAMSSPRHQAYEAYADSLTGIHFPQDYLAISRLLETGEMDGDAIVVNGQTGDFISGNHVLPPLTEPAGDAAPEVRWERILSTSLRKHFKMWRSLETPEAQAPIKDRLRQDMEALGGLPASPLGDHGLYEYSEFVNRQSKYVIHGQRCYEFLGLDWRLPLWDREYLDFWARAPLAAKRHQGLYRQVLEADNWGGVWRDLPVNPRRIRPAWLVPVRFAAKLMHAPLGRTRWHRFEKRYLDYWMAPLCSYAPWSYRRVARDRRGHVNALSWYCEAYLDGKGVAWNGEVLPA